MQLPAQAPAAILAGLTGDFAAPDSTVKQGIGARFGGLIAGDSAVFRHFKNDTLVKANRRPAVGTMRDSIFAPAPAYGQTATYKSCVQLERGGRNGTKMPTNPCTHSLTWTYTRPAPPPPASIDSLWRITIRQIPLVPGGPYKRRRLANGQLAAPTDSNVMKNCAFAENIVTGERGITTSSDTVPICHELLKQWLAEKRA